jgi:integral membrane protein (TIGR00529 family)
MEILKLLIPIVILLILILLKVQLSIAIFSGGLILAFIFGISPSEILKLTLNATIASDTIQLLVIIFMVLLLGQILKAKESLKIFVEATERILKKKSLIISFSPALIGLLPMPGGALVSAPILNETLEKDNMSPELKTYINFWFRHIWEYIWPLYPGLILTVGIFKVDFISLFKHQFYFTILAIIIGAVFMKIYLPELKDNKITPQPLWKNLFQFVLGLWEILLIIAIVMIFKIKVYLSITIVVLFSFIILKKSLKEKYKIFLDSLKPSILLTIIAVMVFKTYILHSDVILITKKLILGAGSYKFLIMFFVPFIIGFLTGVNSAFAGISFPLFISIVGTTNPDMWKIMYLYVSGFAGVLLSPVHFCFVLSAQYFKAKLKDVYKYLLPSVLILIIISTILFILIER